MPKVADQLTNTDLSPSDLTWIERQLPLIKEPFARLLILILLLALRRCLGKQKEAK